MKTDSSKNKLIILLNLSGSYKGGAQKRYLALINYLQKNNITDYFFLLNDALYEECLKDHIITDNKNIICIPIKYGKKVLSKSNRNSISKNTKPVVVKLQKSSWYDFLGSLSSFLKQFKSWIGFSSQLIRIVKTFNIGVIYGVFTGGIWSWQVARLMNVKFIYSYNDSSAGLVEKKILKILSSEYYPLKFADKVDFLSEGILDKLNEKGLSFKENKVLFTPNSFILYDGFFPVYPKEKWIVFSARLTKIKNPQLLLEAVLLLKKQNFTDFIIYFLGEGILFTELSMQKKELKLENVYFEGGVTNTAKYLMKSKIFVSIQNDNNYPSQSLLEAMACENAIIASDVGETRKLITEKEGILVPFDATKIANAIIKLLTDSAECERLGKNARRKALEKHNIDKYSEYFFEITNTNGA